MKKPAQLKFIHIHDTPFEANGKEIAIIRTLAEHKFLSLEAIAFKTRLSDREAYDTLQFMRRSGIVRMGHKELGLKCWLLEDHIAEAV